MVPAYQSAVLETDSARMPGRITEALKAIEARTGDPGRIGDAELRALADAQRGLATLKAERVDGSALRIDLPLQPPADQE
jgi:hypothetical protein